MADDFDARSSSDQAAILCPDAAWSLALMKFTMDEADLGEGGRRGREIEALFRDAAGDRAAVPALKKKLDDYGLFADYEDRFLALF